MSGIITTASTKFPEGYGNLALRSSDGIVCSFPKSILSHTSVVFRDMFNLGGDTADSLSQPLQLTEPNITVELFLSHLDPNILTPNIDPETVEGLILMAHKYQTSVIMRWFEQEVRIRPTTTAQSTMPQPFLSTHPALTLSLCIKFDLDQVGKLAFIEMLGCCTSSMTAALPFIPPSTYLLICQHRERRIRQYNEWIYVLAGDIPSNGPQRATPFGAGERAFWNTTDTVEFRHMAGGGLFGTVPAQSTFSSSSSIFGAPPPRVVQSCAKCSSKRAKWILGMARAVQDSPLWSNFLRAYNDQGACCISWVTEFQRDLDSWKTIAEKEEATAPSEIF